MILKITLLCLSLLDITLTYYYFFMMDKKGVFDPKEEKGIVPKFFIKGGLTSKGFLWASITTVLYVWAVLVFVPVLIPYVIGVSFMVNMMHYHNISNIRKFWNNARYWEIYKEIKEFPK